MVKKTDNKRSVRSNRHPAGGDTVRRFAEGPVRETSPVQQTVQVGSVDVKARTLTAVVATNAPRLMEIWDDDICRDVIVKIRLVKGMDFSRSATGMPFLDNHNTGSARPLSAS